MVLCTWEVSCDIVGGGIIRTISTNGSLNAIVAYLKKCPFEVVPLLHSVSELTILYSKIIRLYIDVSYIVDFTESR